MPTAVLDVDLFAPPEFLEAEGEYEAALVLVRWAGRPIGAVRVALEGSRVHSDDVVAVAQGEFPGAYWRHWLTTHLEVSPRELADIPRATVAVCTRDRPDDLAKCLESIRCLPDDGQEVLVVDSCSTTGATALVATEAPGVRYVRADRPGLDIARNVALRAAQNEIVAFCDDDARVDPGWLHALLPSFMDPCVLAVTGLTMPVELETPAQEWFETFSPFGRGFRRKVYDVRTVDALNAGALGAGANMALRRSVLSLVGEFDEALDAGTATRSGGDTDMFRRILAGGYRVVYEPSALSWHRHRRTWPELVDVEYGYGVGVYAGFTAALLDGDLRVPAHVARGLSEWHLPQLVGSLTGSENAAPRDTSIAFSRGSLLGPIAYWRRASSSPRFRIVTNTPLVSVVVADRRRRSAARLLDALSASDSIPGEIEVVVVTPDPDACAAAIGTRERPFGVVLERGDVDNVAAARNRGAIVARGSLLVFLDDDVLPERALLAVHTASHDAESPRAVIGSVRSHEAARDVFNACVDLEASDRAENLERPDHRLTYRDVAAGNLSLPAAVFHEVGMFREELPAREGCELGIRLLARGVDLCAASDARASRETSSALLPWLARARDEGRADVILLRLHGNLSPMVQDARGDDPSVLRIVRRLTFATPGAVEPLMRSLARSLDIAERARQRSLQRRLVRTLHFLAYWQGVAEEAHSHGELVGLLRDAGPAEPSGDAEVDIDLAVGVEAAEARLDLERPTSARIWLGRREVGSIPAVLGAEPLRGRHLRPLLAGPLAGSFAKALQEHNATPVGETSPEVQKLANAAARTRQPLVSVVIPFLDAEPFLDEAIGSVFDQTYSRWELILVDDGSSDGSTEIARSYAKRFSERVRYVTHPGCVNLGEGATRNRGIAEARGEYVAFVDADDTWLPHKLETQVPLLVGRPEVAAAWGPTLWWPPKVFDSVVEEVRHLAVETDRVWNPPDLAIRFIESSAKTPGVMSALVRRDVAQAVGGYDESLRIYADQVFFVRLCLRTPVYVHSVPLERYRLHADSACARAAEDGVFDADGGPSILHARYLDRLNAHLRADGVTDVDVWDALDRAALPYRAGVAAAAQSAP